MIYQPVLMNLPKSLAERGEPLKSAAGLPGAVELIRASLDLEEMPADIIALGSLTNIVTTLETEPGLKAGTIEEGDTQLWAIKLLRNLREIIIILKTQRSLTKRPH